MPATLRKAREAMAKVDTAWLHMEGPTNRMMVTAVMIFKERMQLAHLRRLMEERFLAYPRFRQKAVDALASAYWETDADFDIDWHVCAAALPGKADKAELENFVSELASTPLDPARPMWQFLLIDNYAPGGERGGSVVIARIHHCYADGMALVQVVLSLTDANPARNKRAELAKVWLKKDQGSVLQRLLEPASAGLSQAITLGEKALDKAGELVAHPDLIAALARDGGDIARELAFVLTLANDPPTAFKQGELGQVKRVAWAESLPLDEVKAIGNALGCTVNDVLLACATGALRGYLHEIGEKVDGLTIRATVPVNLRPLEHAKKLGNHFGLVFLDLPVGEANPLHRLERVAANMRELKKSKQAALTFGLLAAVGMAPAAIQRLALEFLSGKASAVATNVPGPQMPLYLAGCELSELMFWVPQSGSIGMGLSILSYNGRVYFGLIVDGKRVPDPGPIVRRFAPEFEKLVLIALMEDWQHDITAADAQATLAHYNPPT
jgi:WS/DGAT/MGAT family acyltransferase